MLKTVDCNPQTPKLRMLLKKHLQIQIKYDIIFLTEISLA